MAVTPKHISGTLRILDGENKTRQTLTRIRPNVSNSAVARILEATSKLTEPSTKAVLVTTTELEAQ